MVSAASTTGSKSGFGDTQTSYFKRIANMELHNPQIVGFGIADAATFSKATLDAKGAIIGSAFIKHLTKEGLTGIANFIKGIR
jgi:tryptophan synthase alpha chain